MLADSKMTLGIHREAPPFADQSTAQEILVTGIKVRCMFAPLLHVLGMRVWCRCKAAGGDACIAVRHFTGCVRSSVACQVMT